VGLFACLLGLGVQAQSAAPGLFADADTAGADIQYDQPAEVERHRYVYVDLALLPSREKEADGAPPEITFNLFPNANFIGVVKRVEESPEIGTAWIGELKGKAGGSFTIVVVEDTFIAHIASREGIFEVSYAADELYRVVQIDQSQFRDHPEGTYEHLLDNLPVDGAAPEGEGGLQTDGFAPEGDGGLQADGVAPEGDGGLQADSGSIIDIMVAYTDDARAAEGSTAAMKARIALAVTETNQSYANSGVNPRLRLVHVEEYSYAETGNLNTDLARFRGVGDGYFETIHSLRNTYGADMVGLIVENGGSYCGLASAIYATATTAFQVTDRGCATGYYSFGHEFGHLQAARHDIYVDPSTTPYAYGHGYVHRGSTAAQRWRTIMAYNDYCSVVGYNCTRLKWWSNPSKFYNGAAMGNSTAQNYRVLNNTPSTVANFRTQVIGNNFNNSFNTSASGWSAVYGPWALASSAYYRSTGVANMGASAKQSGTYGDLTYEVRMMRAGGGGGLSNRIIIRGNPASLDATKLWKPSYLFQYNNSGSFSVYEVTSSGSVVALKNWTASGAIVKNGWNTLKVVAVGTSLKFYINGTLVWTGSDSSLKTGKVGFGFYRDATAATLYVDWAKLSTTPTADLNPNADVAPGVELKGGTINASP
jgi:hypothetical protein